MQELYWKFLFCNTDTFSHRLLVLANRGGTCLCLQVEGFFTSVMFLTVFSGY